MKNKTLLLWLFLVVALFQWLVPLSSIYKKEIVESSGNRFCFKMRPVDPAHPFSGRYMALQFAENSTLIHSDTYYKQNTVIYLEIGVDDDQYAVIKDISLMPFTHTTDFIKATVDFCDRDRVYFTYPFERYYLNEDKAKPTEEKIVPLLQDSTHRVCAMVKILNGETTLEDIYIDHQPLSDRE